MSEWVRGRDRDTQREADRQREGEKECESMSVFIWVQFLRGSEEGARSSAARVTSVCEVPHVDIENRTQVLSKSSSCHSILSILDIPRITIPTAVLLSSWVIEDTVPKGSWKEMRKQSWIWIDNNTSLWFVGHILKNIFIFHVFSWILYSKFIN